MDSTLWSGREGHAEVVGRPRKTPGKNITANQELALAA